MERHQVRINAPADVTFEAATRMNLEQSPIIRAIFRAREWILRSHPAPRLEPGSLIDQMRGIGWGVLAEVPGREIVMGAVTQPWMADVVFRPLPPEEFAAFHDPNFVKIVWTLRAVPVNAGESVFRTEKRAVATDPVARAKFRRYWSFVSPGIILIRSMLLGPLKADAERRGQRARVAGQVAKAGCACSLVWVRWRPRVLHLERTGSATAHDQERSPEPARI